MNLLVALELGALAGLIIVGLGFLGVVVGALDIGLHDPDTEVAREEDKRERERQRKWRARRDGAER